MHQPRPYGLNAVGGELTDEDSAAIELLSRRLTNLKDLSGVSSLRMVRSLPDGGYVIAQDMGGTFRVITHKPVSGRREDFDGVATSDIPMLFSGVVTSAILRPGQGLGMKLTEQTRRRLSGYGAESMPAKDVSLQRFAIPYHTMVSELAPSIPTQLLYTQYAAQRPSWYTGAMAEIMQIVGGYGIQDLDSLPENPIERANMIIPEGVMRKIRLDIGNVRLPGYTGIPDKEGKFQYDYKFHNTNGVGFDTSGNPWLLRISAEGVFAMPLPMIPATTTQAFREYIQDSGDSEIEDILDRFGGLPSGETFPIYASDFEAWRRAGVIIKVCETADFYNHIMYSSACGWALNSKGLEGYNTCYDYYDDEGLGYGLTYKLKLNLSPANNNGKLPQSFDLEDDDEARALDAYLSGVYQLLGDSPNHLAIKYKIRRVPVQQILSRAGNVGANEVDYWDRLELDPIARHTGSVSEIGRGYLYHGASFEFQPQIKFPEPFLGGCVSHDFLPLDNGRYRNSYPNSDTIMFCYYVDDELKTIKYFREERDYAREVVSDFEECMIVGSWSRTVTYGSSSLVGNFYMTDVDDRRTMAPIVETTEVVGRDLGYDHTPYFSFSAFSSMCGQIWRNRYYSIETKSQRTEGQSMRIGVCIPYLTRSAALYAYEERTTGSERREGAEGRAMRDPNQYFFWTYDEIFHWVGCYGTSIAKSRPYPKDGSPNWVEFLEGGISGPCSDFADQGEWIEIPADYTWLIHPEANVWHFNGGGGPPSFQSYSNVTFGDSTHEGNLQVSIVSNIEEIHRNIPDTMYFMGSPDEYLGVFYRDACKIEFGQMEYASVSEGGELRRRWGYTGLATHKSAHHFFGVINE